MMARLDITPGAGTVPVAYVPGRGYVVKCPKKDTPLFGDPWDAGIMSVYPRVSECSFPGKVCEHYREPHFHAKKLPWEQGCAKAGEAER
jgi:hypothetical protein